MKKLLSFSIAIVLAVGLLFTGCGNTKQETDNQAPVTDTSAPTQDNKTEPEAQLKPIEVSENREVVAKDAAPKVYMIQNADNNTDSMTYHLDGCKTLEGKEVAEVPWEMVQMIGFWQCPVCNPPRYENYTNAK